MAKKHKQGRPSKGPYHCLTLRFYHNKYPRLDKTLNLLSKVNKTSLNDTIQEILYNFINKQEINLFVKLQEDNKDLEQEVNKSNEIINELNEIINKQNLELSLLKIKLNQSLLVKSKKEISVKSKTVKIKDHCSKRKICISMPTHLMTQLNHILIDKYETSFGHIGETFEAGLRLWLKNQIDDAYILNNETEEE